ncbi:hypothetical protein LTS08_006647 [Lithohypha guttulata]|uniref:uncharacterized protein n=1 Tax=Lithohypha guttulata TaxID=1690604 RepID=UPI002DE0CF77|nr:hypothetical protein LTR51_008024 [Lithohypha guttulata]KAK5097892.1 hypothetical protein LTS08_006647 [Lithohypha guttulata]
MPFEPEIQPYSDIHYLSNVREPNDDDLRAIIRTYPLIDNHAHNLLREEEADGNADHPFESITSEAQGHALQEHVQSTLAHIRGLRHLADLYDCPPSLQDIKAARYDFCIRDYNGLIRKCLAGTHALLLDDGLPQDHVHPVRWHDKYAPTVRRIARIEVVAAELLEQLAHAAGLLVPGVDTAWSIEKSEWFIQRFNIMFRNQIKQLAADPLVVGFKSVVCYRSGLDVNLASRNAFRPHQSLAETSLLTSFHHFLREAVGKHDYRVGQKDVNDFLVVATCDVLSMLVETEGETKPFQFHTGLGDTDIDLVKANPAFMQPLLEAFPNVDFVILHSSWPYTREAGYLAANYANAWLDIGEVFPMLSRQGQEDVLRQALELTPASKILWSTDGHFFPETFYLANRQFREALQTVLGEMVCSKDVTTMQAINIAVDILFWNSNALYKLDEERKYPQLLRSVGRNDTDSQRTTLWHRGSDVSQNSPSTAGLDSAASTAIPSPATTHRTSRSRRTSNYSMRHRPTRPLTGPSVDQTMSAIASSQSLQAALRGDQQNDGEDDIAALNNFMIRNPEIKFIWLEFISNTGTVRNRMVPIKGFKRQLITKKYIGITCALPRLLQNELPAAGCDTTGEFKLRPDLSSLRLNKGVDSPSASVQTWWMMPSHNDELKHWDRCPRWALLRQVEALQNESQLSMLLGFEIEVIFMKPIMNSAESAFEDFEVVNELHSWSNMTCLQTRHLPFIESIVETLAEVGIELEQFHAESAPSQWEFPLPPLPPVQAVDQLYKARQIISNIAQQNGLRATVYPRPYSAAAGSASHAHFSLNGPLHIVQEHENAFLAGVLKHLSSIVALSLPLEESYARVASGVWSGGEWIAWGTQNREAPIRKCGHAHWEMKTVDGTGNMYLAMAAAVAAGRDGLNNKVKLKQKDTLVDVCKLSAEERQQQGITERIPKSLNQSLQCLGQNQVLIDLLGKNIVNDYIAVKEAERAMLEEMTEHDRKVWLISRY